MQRNVEHLAGLFKRRGFTVETTTGPGSPVVFASLDAPSPRGTLTLYIHYDGQPVTASEWTRCKPFAPCLYGPTGEVPLVADDRRSIPTGGSTAAPSPTTKAPSSRC